MDNHNHREYAWKQYQLHSHRRTWSFHFFIIVSVVILGTSAVLLDSKPVVALVGGIIQNFISFVFWRLDYRISMLIEESEKVLMYVEQDTPGWARLISNDASNVRMRQMVESFFVTFRRGHTVIYYVTAMMGAILATYVVLHAL